MSAVRSIKRKDDPPTTSFSDDVWRCTWLDSKDYYFRERPRDWTTANCQHTFTRFDASLQFKIGRGSTYSLP